MREKVSTELVNTAVEVSLIVFCHSIPWTLELK